MASTSRLTATENRPTVTRLRRAFAKPLPSTSLNSLSLERLCSGGELPPPPPPPPPPAEPPPPSLSPPVRSGGAETACSITTVDPGGGVLASVLASVFASVLTSGPASVLASVFTSALASVLAFSRRNGSTDAGSAVLASAVLASAGPPFSSANLTCGSSAREGGGSNHGRSGIILAVLAVASSR